MKISNLKTKSFKNGFTLIELIIVSGIIALIASIVLASVSDSQIKGRNAATIQQVGAYENAIGLYIIHNNNRYPDVGDEDMHCVGSGDNTCLWGPLGEVSTETSGALVDLENHISGLPFVNTPILTGVSTYRGLLYQCNDSECRTANFYWPEINVNSCTKGTIHYTGTNGVICTQLAEGVRN